MKEYHSVFASDAINLNLVKFTTGSLVRALSDQWDIGMPAHMSHDLTRLIGWARPTMVYFEPGLARLAGVNLMPETESETEEISQAQRTHITRRVMETCSTDKVDKLKEKIGPHLNGREIPHGLNYVALYRDGLAREVFKSLFDGADKDGLIPTSRLKYVSWGIFEQDGLLLFAHPRFRRSNTRLNNLNTTFLDRFLDILASHQTMGSIALDPDLVGLAGTQVQHMEHEYWWGPKFSDDISNIPTGVTHHEADEYERLFHCISATEFWWQSRDSEHILEVEELRDSPTTTDGIAEYACRYVHSIVDERTKQVKHLDGAVRSYKEEEMVKRLECKISESGRHTKYTKLWRLDAPIEVVEWKGLVSDYFRDNHLVGEYFGIDPKEKTGRPEIISESNSSSPIHKFVRYSVSRGSGVRVAASFHELRDFPSDNPLVVPLDRLSFGDKTMSVVPSDTLELKKVCSRKGFLLDLPGGVEFIAFEDLYTDFPLIKIPLRATEEKLVSMTGVLKDIVQATINRGQDRVVSFSIGLPLKDREFRISVLGEVHDLKLWLDSPISHLPLDLEDIFEWADDVAEYLEKNFKSQVDVPSLSDIFRLSGILFIERTPIQASECEASYSKDDRGLVYDLRIPKDNGELADALQSNRLFVCSSFLINRSECSRCHQEYRNCPCSKYLDAGVGQLVKKCELAFPYYTDRPAMKTYSA